MPFFLTYQTYRSPSTQRNSYPPRDTSLPVNEATDYQPWNLLFQSSLLRTYSSRKKRKSSLRLLRAKRKFSLVKFSLVYFIGE